MSYVLRNFKIWELVPPEVYASKGDAAIELFDPEALAMLDDYRDFLGVPVTVNNWKFWHHTLHVVSQRALLPRSPKGEVVPPHKR